MIAKKIYTLPSKIDKNTEILFYIEPPKNENASILSAQQVPIILVRRLR
jgi:hypothetical protein